MSPLAGALLSATSTSPFGSTSSQRGCARPWAKATTRVPRAGKGVAPAGQPTAGAMFTVGMRALRGSGSSGCGPVPAAKGRRADSAQAPRKLQAVSRATVSQVCARRAGQCATGK